MTTIPIPRARARPSGHAGPIQPRSILLVCGIYSALLYTAMLFFVPGRWPGYSSASQTISELSALGAPTRPLWVTLGLIYTVLWIGFGWGVRLSAGSSRHLRIAGGLIIAAGVIGPFWPPMHLRGTEPSLTDSLHIAFAIAWNVLTIATLVLAAAALGGRFRLYSALTLAVLVVFGTLTGLDGPRVAADLPTPWVGIWERILMAAWLLWVVALAVVLLRRPVDQPLKPWPGDRVTRAARPTEAATAGSPVPAAADAGLATSRKGGIP